MRILHLLPTLSGGGAERQMSYLARELQRAGHEVHVAFLHEGPKLACLEETNIHLHKLRASGNYDPGLLRQLLCLIRHVKPDIVQTWIVQMDVLGGIAARLTRTPWLLREPTSAVYYTGSWKFKLRLLMAGGVSAVVPNSKGGESYWRKHYPEKPCYVIPNGLLLEEIDQVAVASDEDARVSSGRGLILYAGRLEPGKNLENLLVGYSLAIANNQSQAVICGGGSLRETVEGLVRELGLTDRVRIAGFLESSQVWGLMKRADVFTFVSAFEGMPNVVMEAMACGCPLVVSDIPAHREILDEDSALFVDPTDPSAIADAIIECLSDRAAARRRATAARQVAARWSVQAMAASYEKVYSEILRNR